MEKRRKTFVEKAEEKAYKQGVKDVTDVIKNNVNLDGWDPKAVIGNMAYVYVTKKYPIEDTTVNAQARDAAIKGYCKGGMDTLASINQAIENTSTSGAVMHPASPTPQTIKDV